MNENTLVGVFGYAGDAQQIWDQLKTHEAHKCPIVIFSPMDSPITRMGPHICRWAGKRAYIGEDSTVRQAAQMKLLLEYPFDWYLLNDSDSVCLSKEIPAYLYKEPLTFWSNIVSDEMHPRKPGYPWPRLAFQPPYFMSRTVLKKFLEVAGDVRAEPQTPFIDWWMMAVAVQAKIIYKNFPHGASLPSSDAYSRSVMSSLVRQGKCMVHSIKRKDVLTEMKYRYFEFVQASQPKKTRR